MTLTTIDAITDGLSQLRQQLMADALRRCHRAPDRSSRLAASPSDITVRGAAEMGSWFPGLTVDDCFALLRATDDGQAPTFEAELRPAAGPGAIVTYAVELTGTGSYRCAEVRRVVRNR